MTTRISTAPQAQSFEQWTLRGLIARHKRATLVLAGLCALMVIPFVLVAVGSKGAAIADTTTCTQWGNTTQNGQSAYGRLYLREHGPVQGFGGPQPAAVVRAINWGCGVAYGDDVSDETTVVQAIKGNY